MSRWLFIGFLLLLLQKGQSQYLYGSKGFGVHAVPLVLIDKNPRIRLGFEYHRNDLFGYGMEISWGNHSLLPLSLIEGVWGKNYSIFEIRPEIKWYQFESSVFEFYYAVELFYNHMTDRLHKNEFYPNGSSVSIFYDEASFKRQKIGLLLRGGNKLIFSENIIVDSSIGFGFAFRDIQYTDVLNPQVRENINEWFFPSYRVEGEKLIWQMNASIKVGFTFRK